MASFADALGKNKTKTSKRRKLSKMEKYKAKWGYLFISPWLIGFAIFTVVPMIASFVFSLMDFQLATPEDAHFIGLENWNRMLFNDPNVWASLGVTFKFAIITLPIGFSLAIFLAILLNSHDLIGKNVFRTLFYAPTMVPGIAAILIWSGVLNSQTGWLNRGIQSVTGYPAVGIGDDAIRWLDKPELIYFAYTFIGIWAIGNTILITMAGLQGVPTDLYDASKVDGAGWWRRLWHITLPMISPVIFYNLVLGVIGLLQFFNTPYVLNGGNGYPEGSTNFFMIYFYKQAFAFANMGYAATLAWFLFIISLALTLLLFGTARHWVYYAGAE